MRSEKRQPGRRTLFDPRRDNPAIFSRSLTVQAAPAVSKIEKFIPAALPGVSSEDRRSIQNSLPSSTDRNEGKIGGKFESRTEENTLIEKEIEEDKTRLRRKRTEASKPSSSSQTESRRSADRKSQQLSGGAFFVLLKTAYSALTSSEAALHLPRLTSVQLCISQVEAHHSLAAQYHAFMLAALGPAVPVSMHALPARYNIPVRLWKHASLALLEHFTGTLSSSDSDFSRLFPAADSNSTSTADPDFKTALEEKLNIAEIFSGFVLKMYSFYTALLEDPLLEQWKSVWMENLGDLARYQIVAVTFISKLQEQQQQKLQNNFEQQQNQEQKQMNLQNNDYLPRSASVQQTVSSHPRLHQLQESSQLQLIQSSSGKPTDIKQPSPKSDFGSICHSQQLVRSWQIDEVSLWRHVAREWYFRALADLPGTGRLHHQLAILCRGSTEPLRGLYHYVKAITTSHPFLPSKEAVLGLFDARFNRNAAGAIVENLFVHLHSLLFTCVQLDDFEADLERFLEALEEEGIGQTQQFWGWVAAINIAAVMQYGSEESILKMTLMKDEKKISNASSKVTTSSTSKISGPKTIQKKTSSNLVLISAKKSSDNDDPLSTFGSIITDTVGNEEKIPKSHTTISSSSNLTNPSNPDVFSKACQLMFSILKLVLLNSSTCGNVYTSTILTFTSTVLKCENAKSHIEKFIPWRELAAFLTKAPLRNLPTEIKLFHGFVLPEDWALRGMEWVGRRVYERGFWKAGGTEGEVFESLSRRSQENGIVDEQDAQDMSSRWRRVGCAASIISRNVPGFGKEPCGWVIYGALERKLIHWQREEDSKSQIISASSSDVSFGSDSLSDLDSDSSNDEDIGSYNAATLELKKRRRELLLFIRSARSKGPKSSFGKKPTPREGGRDYGRAVPGFTLLVLDTNVLLSALNVIQKLAVSKKLTSIIPLPVLTELRGLSKQRTSIGDAALSALDFIQRMSLLPSAMICIQSVKGNNLRYDSLDLDASDNLQTKVKTRLSMDDLIIKAAIWLSCHWNFKEQNMPQHEADPRVVLVSFDRIMRLKARAANLAVADEVELNRLYAIPDG